MGVYKTHNCGEIRKNLSDSTVKLSGWVLRRRDHGGVIFIDLRDRTGFCQIVFRPETSKECHAIAEHIRSEYVLTVTGKVIPRTPENINAKIPTGEIEIEAFNLEILAKSKTPPFELDETCNASEEIRLEYRYLDLRRENMKDNIIKRHRFSKAVRERLDKNGFIDIETPVLNKSTPEGARDFIVPSRLNRGMFYALPQSPQIFKQILMISGFEKYYQIVKCFRDEDLRADRQPEFTQIDIETSFLSQTELMSLMEEIILSSLNEVFGIKTGPVPRMAYNEAMERFGSDRPDTRFGLELVNFEEAARLSEFKVFQTALEKGIVRGLCVPGGDALSRKDIDDFTSAISVFGAKGLAWMRMAANGLESSIVKFFPDECRKKIISASGAKPGDLLLFVADSPKITYQALGFLRLAIAEKLKIIPSGKFNFLWVHDFPLFEHDSRENRLSSVHHPFTMPSAGQIAELETNPLSVLSQSYDFVCNGIELGGGSIRINDLEIQKKIFSLLGISDQEADEKFGFLLKALAYGAPPHGGIAFGLDRIMMIMQGCSSIRDVIAFPKTQRGQCVMSSAPGAVLNDQLAELAINITL